MSENTNIDNQRLLDDLYSSRRACLDRIERCDYLLSRLKPVKDSIASQKHSFQKLRKEHRDIVKDKNEWKGNRRKEFNNHLTRVTESNDLYYKYTLDRILDSLNNEITRLENQKMNEFGLLGRLASQINNVLNAIENFVN